uniref:HeH/LEM domain-containing protein n=1 Tax=viral metagenome TaxID=1070528 RepID=A0A6C0B538_9ZZZZ
MEFFHGVVALVAGIVLILTGLVAWMYVQQSRMAQAINALAIAITAPPPSFGQSQSQSQPEQDTEPEVSHEDELHAPAPAPEAQAQAEAEHDDRVSVHEDEDVELMGEDMATLGGKTAVQLREMLTTKGIPYSKSDKKSTLISLLQAAS